MDLHRARGISPEEAVEAVSKERDQLRFWLHRIEEECARKSASDHDVRIRNAALAALRGTNAPGGFGLPLEI